LEGTETAGVEDEACGWVGGEQFCDGGEVASDELDAFAEGLGL
jgi:hypothetical protein